MTKNNVPVDKKRMLYYAHIYSRMQYGVLSHMPLCISMISGVCVQGMWNAQVKGQVTETHRLKVNSHCDTALLMRQRQALEYN